MSDSKKIILVKKSASLANNNALELISNSPMVKEAFVRALAETLTKVAGRAVSGVVVEFDAAVKATQVELSRHEIRVRIGRLQITTEEYARAVRNAEIAEYPEAMKQQLVEALYKSLKRDLENCKLIQDGVPVTPITPDALSPILFDQHYQQIRESLPELIRPQLDEYITNLLHLESFK